MTEITELLFVSFLIATAINLLNVKAEHDCLAIKNKNIDVRISLQEQRQRRSQIIERTLESDDQFIQRFGQELEAVIWYDFLKSLSMEIAITISNAMKSLMFQLFASRFSNRRSVINSK